MHWREIIAELLPVKQSAKLMLDILTSPVDCKWDSVALANQMELTSKDKARCIRHLCEYLALRGVPVVADHEGVWFTTKPSEIHEYVQRRKAEAEAAYATTMERLQVMEDTAHRMSFGKAGEQTSIFDKAI